MKIRPAFFSSTFRALPLFLASPLMAAEQRGPDPSPAVPPGLSATDWGSIRSEYERHRHSAVTTVDGKVMRNPGQQWQTHFDDTGFLVQPDNADWTWGLELKSYGFSGSESAPVLPPRVTTNGPRIAYDWDDTVQEWFVNDERGLEHGFTVFERPASGDEAHCILWNEQSLFTPAVTDQGNDSANALTFTLAVRGGLHPEVQQDGQSVHFMSDHGVAVLTYAGLKVWDADGKILPASFEPVNSGESTLRLTVDESGARYPLTIDPIVQQAYLKASSTAEGSVFGYAVAVSGDTVVIGAVLDDSSGANSGAAYVFLRTGTAWSQQAVLKPAIAGGNDQFGWSVAIAGNTIVVGTPWEDSSATGVNGNAADNSAADSGAAWVFFRSGPAWTQQAYLKASNTDSGDGFGGSVAVTGDTVIVGAPQEASAATGVNQNQADNSATQAGAAYVFVRGGTQWTQQAYFKASNTEAGDLFGWSVAAAGDTIVVGATSEDSSASGVNGNQLLNAATDSGAAYVFVRSGTAWSQQAYLKASNTGADDRFGFAVGVSGDTIVAGARWEASSTPGNQNDNTAVHAGAAYVFLRSGTTWSQQAYLKALNPGAGDQFSQAVAVSGDTIVIGAHGEASSATGIGGSQADNNAALSGAAYVFIRNGTAWSQQAYLKASNTGAGDNFGWAVAVSGNTVVTSAWMEDSSAAGVNGNQNDNASNGSGAGYVFVRNTNTWSQQAYLKPYNPAVANDQFGWSVGVSGDTVVVGAPQESSNATGINGNQGDSSALNAGAAYVFHRSGGVWRQEAYLKASNTEEQDHFGSSVAAAGDFVVVGATEEDSGIGGVNQPNGQGNNAQANSGAAYVFVRSIDGFWSQQAYVKASNPANLDRFGTSMAASGETVVIGAPDQDIPSQFTSGAGAAYVFVRNGGVWTEQAFLKASNPNGDDRFGTSVGVSGNTIVVGAEREDSNATGIGGNEINLNGPNSGAAYVFVRSSVLWTQQAYLKASNTGAGDAFGGAVAVSGDTVVVAASLEDSNATGVNHATGQSDNSASGSGAAYIFTRSLGTWSQQAYVKASNTDANDTFGSSVATTGDTVVVGASVETSNATGVNGVQNNNSAPNAGAAYIFTRSGGIWSQQAYLKASNLSDRFGAALAMSGSTLVVGAFSENSNARGVNGNQNDISANDSGAAYVFNLQAQTALTSWRVMWFGSPDNSGPGADMADPDGDGLVNLMEFATGQEPFTRLPLPATINYNGSQLEFTYPRSKAAHAEMQFIVEWSDSLAANTWTINGTGETIESETAAKEQVKVTIAAGPSAKRFVRLRVASF